MDWYAVEQAGRFLEAIRTGGAPILAPESAAAFGEHVIGHLRAKPARLRHEDGRGNLRQDPGAVTGLGVRGDSASVRYVDDGFERPVQDRSTLRAGDVGDEADAASVMFVTWVV